MIKAPILKAVGLVHHIFFTTAYSVQHIKYVKKCHASYICIRCCISYAVYCEISVISFKGSGSGGLGASGLDAKRASSLRSLSFQSSGFSVIASGSTEAWLFGPRKTAGSTLARC